MDAKESKKIETLSVLPDVERRCAQLICLGMSQAKIAKLLGVTEPTISVWKGKDQFSAYLQRLRSDAHEAFRSAQEELLSAAVVTFMEIMANGQEDSKIKVASLIYQKGLPVKDGNQFGGTVSMGGLLDYLAKSNEK